MARSLIPIIALVACFVALCVLYFARMDAPDLMASYIAGEFFGMGRPDQVYPGDTTLFTMSAPEAWRAHMDAQGYTGYLFPYIYPPLWAALMSWLTPLVSYPTFHLVAIITYALMLSAMLAMAARLTRTKIPLSLYLLLGFLILGFSVNGWVALAQAQPQILVSFLIVLAFERQITGNPITAGAALACAAALKVYPALFLILWLGLRDWRASLAFLGFGGALGLTSIALAGWPLHATFLHQLSLIDGTVMVNNLTYSLQSLIALLSMGDTMTFLADPLADPSAPPEPGERVPGMLVFAKPPILKAAATAALLGLMGALAWMLHKHPALGRDPLFWATSVMLMGLFSPLAWAHYYLPAIVFLPALYDRLGPLKTAALVAIPLILLSMPLITWTLNTSTGLLIPVYYGTLATVVLTAAFIWATLKGHDEGLHPGQASL